jgi:hypothetical protein
MKQQDPHIEVVLSRPAYRQGGKLVGTVRVTHDAEASPREDLRSLEICVLGRCRLDPRWHNVREYQDIQLVAKNSLLWGLEHDKSTVCFWATQPIDLLLYHERIPGRWDDVKPKPILLEEEDVSNISLENLPLEDQQLSFTFQLQLPSTLPHSMLGTSCRYFYAIVVKVVSKAQKKASWLQIPFMVLTKHPDLQHDDTVEDSIGLSKFRLATLHAMAHSSGLPCAVTATELHRPGGALTVNRHGASLYRHVRRDDPRHLQTLRVADPSGAPVCVLTVFGAHPLHPGSRLILKFDFPLSHNWVPCHQVSACLQGEEVAIRRDGTCRRARSHLFDSAHEYVDHGCTERVALHLMIPLDAPCTIKTDAVSISIRCLVDISLQQGSNTTDFQNLRLELPCEVTHGMAAYETDEADDRPRETMTIDYLLGPPDDVDNERDPLHPSSFRSIGISEELRILSLRMADSCGLGPASTVYTSEL